MRRSRPAAETMLGSGVLNRQHRGQGWTVMAVLSGVWGGKGWKVWPPVATFVVTVLVSSVAILRGSPIPEEVHIRQERPLSESDRPRRRRHADRLAPF
jgi:hypothetical protein